METVFSFFVSIKDCVTKYEKLPDPLCYLQFQKKHQDCITRGHNLKLVNHRCHCDLRKYFFCTRMINTWNSLPESVISASTTDSFKNKLDKFWSNQYLIYNYNAELTGIGNRSFINYLD